MPKHVVLMCREMAFPYLAEYLTSSNETLTVEWAKTVADLERLTHPGALLISFCQGVVVPEAILSRLLRPAYNIHPGSPEYPGYHPEVFAAAEGATRFGATTHEMAPVVDSGAIVDVEWFDVPPGADAITIGERAFVAAVESFRRVGPWLATKDEPLPRIDAQWQGPFRTRAECLALRG